MDRIDFTNSIDNLNDADIIDSFNSVMALYNIVGNYDNLKVSKTSTEVASFDVTFEAGVNIDKIVTECNGMRITLYEKIVSISCTVNDTHSLHITFEIVKD